MQTFEGDVGHGRNQLTLGPDGKIYAIFGDAVFEPSEAQSAVPAIKDPIAAEQARSGFVARTDTDGQNWEVLVRGLRNPFGLDFNSNGDLFTYDADAEYDMGSPWYRPTRVNHLLTGGDYGWRRVTGQWPPYFPDRPDTPQPTLDIGKGSPTAVEFGQGDRFPEPYRDALFVLDWAYGRILAVHWEPRVAPAIWVRLKTSCVVARSMSPTSSSAGMAPCTLLPEAEAPSPLCIVSTMSAPRGHPLL